MANYFTTCCKCGIHFQGQTATSLCYDCLEAENLALKREKILLLQLILSDIRGNWSWRIKKDCKSVLLDNGIEPPMLMDIETFIQMTVEARNNLADRLQQFIKSKT